MSPTQSQPAPLARHSRSRREVGLTAVVWALAVAASLAVAKFLPGAISGPTIVLTAGLATYLVSKRNQRLRELDTELLADQILTIGDVADPRHNAPTRRGPVEAPIDQPPPGASEPQVPHDLAWLARKATARQEVVDGQLTWYIEARAALRAIIDGIDAPVFATDERGLIRLINREGDRMFRRRAGRLAGLELEELFTQSVVLDLHAQAQNGAAGRSQVRIPVDGQPRTFEVSSVPVRMDIAHLPARAAQRAGVVLTLRDVTELARADQLKTDFVANASHELRTPIASIRAAVETFRGPAAEDAGMRERLVRMIDTNIVRLEEMVSDLLDLSHLENPEQAPRPARIELAELAESFRAMFSSICAERNLELIFDFEPGLVTLRTDPKLLQLVLRNLIDNASKFAFEGTPIVVEARRLNPALASSPESNGAGTVFNADDLRSDPQSETETESKSDAESGPESEAETAPDSPDAIDPAAADPESSGPRGPALDGVVLRVRDKGTGIPLKHQQRIFERFYQVDESRVRQGPRRGTGLGLAIVKHAVRVLGGSIALESVWQEGTTMTVTLPKTALQREPEGDATGSHQES
ncbi:MAG: ATP-binding protein [Planctomycetota bacterium]